ncbi:MAG: 2Fe-2S iron-sulfur cluster-binding protein [Pyrinomonadaceae bacterium]
MSSETRFRNFIENADIGVWRAALRELLPEVHEVDRAAVQIWFAFYPLDLARLLDEAEDAAKLVRELSLKGSYRLQDQIDSSHTFLYGHRFWAEAKKATIEFVESNSDASSQSLTEHIRRVAKTIAARTKRDDSVVLGITMVAFMTLAQVGLERLKNSPGVITLDAADARKSPEQILRKRARDNSQGVFGFLRTADKQWTVTFDERDARAKYKVIEGEELASGAARDHSRDWSASDPRRIEGPIPVECRSAACGTCWVGVLGGAEKLSAVSKRESNGMKEFGYINTDEPQPIIRLACMAQASGAVSIVIPPWNGVFGKRLQRQRDEQEASARV